MSRLKKGFKPKRHLFLFFRDVAWPAPAFCVLQYSVRKIRWGTKVRWMACSSLLLPLMHGGRSFYKPWHMHKTAYWNSKCFSISPCAWEVFHDAIQEKSNKWWNYRADILCWSSAQREGAEPLILCSLSRTLICFLRQWLICEDNELNSAAQDGTPVRNLLRFPNNLHLYTNSCIIKCQR